ncbi:MAG TPA: 2OG-Fe(II) oxygenase [Casimicrobiaceae bacterium]|nr:2OG-Fe(II) oxygenase [Casimicrobiaceae bacterium]
MPHLSETSVGRASLARVCSGIAEDGFAIVSGFAGAGLTRTLASEARRRDAAEEFHPSGVGRGAARVERADVRGDRVCWLDASALASPEEAWFEALEALRVELNQRTLLGLFSLEAHYAIYPPGAFYRRHRDRFRDDDARVLSWVLYLNEAWTVADGGALRLHLAWDDARDVLPLGGTLACFLADRFEHEVLPCRRERVSLTGWFRRRADAP